MTHRVARRLAGIAAAVATAAMGWQAVPLGPRLPEVPSESVASRPEVLDANAQAAALLTYDDIVRHNLFDLSRTPPRERYLPPDLRMPPPVSQPASDPATRGPRLVGVATGPGGAVALIDADPSIPGAEIYRIGDAVGAYRLASVSDTAVVLRGKAGARTLRLEPLTGRFR